MTLLFGLITLLQIVPWTLFPGMSEQTDSTGQINVSVVLPLGDEVNPNNSNLDFYSGVLLAAKTLGDEGVKLNVNTFNSSFVFPSFSDLETSDAVLGPIEFKDLESLSFRIPEGRYFISPLDPKATALVDSSRIIQAPTSWNTQVVELVNWMLEEKRPEDVVVVVNKSDAPANEYDALVKDLLRWHNIHFREISYAASEGLNIIEAYNEKSSTLGVTRIFVTSEDEAFVNDVIRNVSVMKVNEKQVALYCPSKVRLFEMIDVNNLYNANVKFTSCYMIDYNNPDVKKFILAYRALYNCEPNSFAFQGYDTMLYFGHIISKYGKHWVEYIQTFHESGLQTSFEFHRYDGKGFINNAVRRISLNPDYSISIQ